MAVCCVFVWFSLCSIEIEAVWSERSSSYTCEQAKKRTGEAKIVVAKHLHIFFGSIWVERRRGRANEPKATTGRSKLKCISVVENRTTGSNNLNKYVTICNKRRKEKRRESEETKRNVKKKKKRKKRKEACWSSQLDIQISVAHVCWKQEQDQNVIFGCKSISFHIWFGLKRSRTKQASKRKGKKRKSERKRTKQTKLIGIDSEWRDNCDSCNFGRHFTKI